uniref:peptidylprolyl isomerase n=1 Tax=Erycina pusilla TaxID=154679 RepID=A0A0F6PL04_9ASPA|nr:FKBP16-3 [Erycina pusilla]
MASCSPLPLLLYNGLSLHQSSLLSLSSTKSFYCCFHKLFPKRASFKLRCFSSITRSMEKFTEEDNLTSRRTILGLISAVSAFGITTNRTNGAGLPEEQKPRLCDEACEKELENVPMVTTETGLQYKDIQVGVGPSPPIGFQVTANYVAMIPNGQIFDSSLDKGQPYIFRVGSGQVIKGLDEGILSMKVGGKRRLFIPGPLAFPKGLSSAAGRPRVAPNSPVVFDVSLEYIPGLELDE